MTKSTSRAVKNGIEQFAIAPLKRLAEKRLGLLCNQSSTDAAYIHSRDIINRVCPGQLTCLFSPQHGFFAEKQDNMIESGHQRDLLTDLPVFSLYGKERKPTAAMLDNIDVLLIDLPDVGTRVYTFMYTVAYCLEAAAEQGKQVVILDRPNPLGGKTVEGNILRDEVRSFVGLYPIPMRHGLTLGELGNFFNQEFNLGADLTVVPMAGWQRSMMFFDTGLPWVFPSPNMPAPTTALVYPGQVIWEGTNISEGRGTTLPFELFGAPFFNHAEFLSGMAETSLPGCFLRPLVFEPTAGKWHGEQCPGFHLHVTDERKFKPYLTTLTLLQAVIKLYPEKFQYKEPPYEYEYEKLPLDLIIGDPAIRKAVEQGVAVLEIAESWQDELREYDLLRRKYFLYD
jgi:uncharacterized protein YbbC (DUF1343 family)